MMRLPVPTILQILLLLLIFSLQSATLLGAHLPAIRPRRDGKRALASRLLRRADGYKDSSLRDVLGESAATERNTDPNASKRARERAQRRVQQQQQQQRQQEQQRQQQREQQKQPDNQPIETISQLFAWAIKHSSVTRRNVSAATTLHDTETGQTRRTIPPQKASSSITADQTDTQRALPRPTIRIDDEKTDQTVNNMEIPEDLANEEVSESDLLRRSLRVLSNHPLRAAPAVAALRVVEELCHSIDNGRDVHAWGGTGAVVDALNAHAGEVRASAAWALATCCQNNPSVQHGALTAGAVPRLAALVVEKDTGDGVRAKALFALNALLEMKEARVQFEDLPIAIHVLKCGLEDVSNVRAIRRTLNLAELLVQKNLDPWKTQLEAWDVPIVVEKLMRTHPDFDVRESAARTIAAMDGKSVS